MSRLDSNTFHAHHLCRSVAPWGEAKAVEGKVVEGAAQRSASAGSHVRDLSDRTSLAWVAVVEEAVAMAGLELRSTSQRVALSYASTRPHGTDSFLPHSLCASS